MTLALVLAAALAAPSRAATVKLFAYDSSGRPLNLQGLLARLGRADDRTPRDPARAPLWAWPVDGSAPVRVKLAQEGPLVTASWRGGAARLETVWPVAGDGYSEVWADNGGNGFDDGAAVFLDEEIAKTQYAAFRASWTRRTTDWTPPFKPSRRERKLADAARDAIAAADRETSSPKRAAAFEAALAATSRAWETELFSHGLQIARAPRRRTPLRFGLTLDGTAVSRLDDLDRIVKRVSSSGSNWVRLVFAPNPKDFLYAKRSSFNEYDGIVSELSRRKLKIMGDVLDTVQWPRKMTPEIYAARVKNVVLHYKGKVAAWEVGPELNGDWFGGADDPMSSDRVFDIYAAGAKQAKALDPQTPVVATLYWWEATAPDRAHSLSGWLKRYVPRGFGKYAGVVGVELFPNDNPVGMSFERAFDEVAAALPGKPLMLSSFGFVEGKTLDGYWWLKPGAVDEARADLMVLYTVAACAMRNSLGGGFWWQTLEQMIPPGARGETPLYKTYRRTVRDLRR